MLRKAVLAFAIVLLPSFAFADIPMKVKLDRTQRGLLASRLNTQIGATVYKTQNMPINATRHRIGITGGTEDSVHGTVRAKQVPVTAPGPFQPHSILLYGPFSLDASLVKVSAVSPWAVTNFQAVNIRPKK